MTNNQQLTNFVHLHVHTHYSLLDGMCKIPELLDKAKELGMEALAITDHGVMYGAIEFYKEAKKRGIKPIIGFEGYIAPRKLTDKTPRVDGRPGHIILLAKDNEGYLNLLKLTSEAHINGYYYKPRIDKELLRKHSKGLIGLSACINGEVGRSILEGDYEKAKAVALEFKEIFDKGDFYLEMQYTDDNWEEQLKVNEGVKKISKETGIPLVSTNDVHYIEKEDSEAQDVLLCLQTGTFADTEGRMKMEGNQSLVSPEEMFKAFEDTPEALENTVSIAQKCNLELELGRMLIPDFRVPKGYTPEGYLRELVKKGLKEKYEEVTKEIEERAEYEINVILSMGFPEYFLIVWDFVRWAKEKGIVVGPGRGSAAGSIVAYALDITELDPLKYDLLFERFLNPDRISMPDIDMDFADDRRGEVIEYVTEKYGKDHVAQIITFGTMKARNAIRDTGRVLGFPYTEVDRIAKMVPEVLNIKIKEAIEQSPDLKAEYKNDSKIKHLLDLAMKLEGVSRHASTHAAGVIISKEALTQYVPLQLATKGELSINTQYSMNPLDDIGLLKMDFLGLSNLTIIKNALRIIKKVYKVEIEIDRLPLDDPKVYKLLSRGDTTGVFQLESAGMKRYLKELKPTVFEDIIAMCALYRPGPLGAGLTDSFVKRKNGLEEVVYDHPTMEPALKNTYGVLVYQEQVMQISKEVCGFTGGQADTLRKAIGKKIRSVMQKMEKEFVEGGVKHSGVPKDVMKRFWKHLLGFADYCFNKSHSACYALIAYQTAYLKAYYPSAYMAALMTSDYGNTDRIAIEIDECRKMGVEVLPPDVNESFAEFGVVGKENKIRFGLMAVKNVGMGIINAILEAREKGGKFKNISDFTKRVQAKEINKKVMEALIKCGAFDSIGEREDLLYNLEKILSHASKIQKDQALGQTDLFGGNGVELADIFMDKALTKLSKKEKLDWEKELLGVYISDHPLKDFKSVLRKEKVVDLKEIKEFPDNKEIKAGGVVTAVKKIYTRSKEQMLFARLEDGIASIELVVFPKILQKYPTRFSEGKILITKGRFNSKDGEPKLLVETARELTMEDADAPSVDPISLGNNCLDIHVPEETGKEVLEDLKTLLLENKGELDTYVYLSDTEGKRKIKLPFGVAYNEELQSQIEALLK